ncbi:hypothetical protein GDO78_023054 [Eleutherodactylus coqui]|uniref:Uncharacterized protein n=1 Tax=Eleutherodactylus coqui TaxID=57060 RepID=A0A8J6BDB3_ELECQ|nr:hypothetical protein GDO78_023054 [Eleutherodactylus coqui]
MPENQHCRVSTSNWKPHGSDMGITFCHLYHYCRFSSIQFYLRMGPNIQNVYTENRPKFFHKQTALNHQLQDHNVRPPRF